MNEEVPMWFDIFLIVVLMATYLAGWMKGYRDGQGRR